MIFTAREVSKYGVISGLCFPALRLSSERYFVSLHIQSDGGKIWARNYSVFARFSRSDLFHEVDNAASLYGKNIGKFWK